MLVDWRIYTWYCPNCKEEVAGLKNKKNQIKVKCSRCGAEMDIYAKVKYNKPWELAPVINQAFSTNSEKESA